MKIEGKFILKVAGTLTAISLVVAALLGATNALTEDKIAAINKANTEVALAAVVSSPDCEFPPIEEIPQAAIDAAKTQSGKLTEVFACGTAAVITPIGQLKGKDFSVGDINAPAGEVTLALRKELTDIQYGRAADRHGWLVRLDA